MSSPKDDAAKIASEARERRYDLFFPRSLGLPTRIGLWLRGYFDARRGKVFVARAGHIDSPYIQRLIEQADLRINAEWQEANGLMFELRPVLEEAVRDRNEVIRRIDELPRLKAAKSESVCIDYDGDEHTSKHLAEKRRVRRTALVEWEFVAREEALRETLSKISARAGVALSQYQDVMDASATHERLVRLDFIARLSCYGRGVFRRMSFDTQIINDRALTTIPREENGRFFAACLRGVENEPATEGFRLWAMGNAEKVPKRTRAAGEKASQ